MEPDQTEQASALPGGIVPGAVQPVGEAPVRFRLYLSLPAPTSVRARANLDAIVASLGERARNFAIETIDVATNPLRAIRDGVIVTPTLMFCGCSDTPCPPIVGEFSDTEMVRAYLEAALCDALQARDR